MLALPSRPATDKRTCRRLPALLAVGAGVSAAAFQSVLLASAEVFSMMGTVLLAISTRRARELDAGPLFGLCGGLRCGVRDIGIGHDGRKLERGDCELELGSGPASLWRTVRVEVRSDEADESLRFLNSVSDPNTRWIH